MAIPAARVDRGPSLTIRADRKPPVVTATEPRKEQRLRSGTVQDVDGVAQLLALVNADFAALDQTL